MSKILKALGSALDVVIEVSKEISETNEERRLLEVERNWLAIKNIQCPSKAVQMAAVKENPAALEFILNPDKNVQMVAVKENGLVIKFIQHPSEDVQLIAVQQNPDAIDFIEYPSRRVVAAARHKIEELKKKGLYSKRKIFDGQGEIQVLIEALLNL